MRTLAWFGAGVLLAGCTVLFAPDTTRGGSGDDDDAGGDGDGGRGGDGGSGDSGPAPDADPNRVRLVFTTSMLFGGIAYGGFPMNGLASGDALCQMLAESAGHEGTFQAWLSDSTGSPSTRFARSGRFELTNGTQIADDWTDLTDGTIDAPIDRNESGNPGPTAGVCTTADVWSNTAINGTSRGDATSCADWTGTGNSVTGRRSEMDADWTATTCDVAQCATSLMPIYCFGQ